jgi:soluble lytic murein transglycosylase-like protein
MNKIQSGGGNETMQAIALARRFVESRGAWLQVIAFVLLIAAVPLFYAGGMTQGRLAQERVDQGRVEMEQKIITLIVERNPQATIREFAGFPRTLLEVSQAADLDFRIILAIADKESGFNPNAVGKSGEIGLMQLMPSTAELVVRRLGLDYTAPELGRNGTYVSLGSLADPKFNVRVGTAYLRWQITRYGFNATALRAYNRNPDKATENRPLDRYAEDVSFRYLAFAHALR